MLPGTAISTAYIRETEEGSVSAASTPMFNLQYWKQNNNTAAARNKLYILMISEWDENIIDIFLDTIILTHDIVRLNVK